MPDLRSRAGGARIRLETAAEHAGFTLAIDEPALVFTLVGTVCVELRGERAIVDRATWLVVPGRTRPRVRVESPTARVLTIEVGAARRAETVADYALETMHAERLAAVVARPRLLSRTTWVHELAHRYTFERAVCGKHESRAAVFLEMELIKEAYFLTIERDAQRERASLSAGPTELVARAVEFIDQNLARKLELIALARHVGASRRTLLRAFERELGVSPGAFVRGRRLDEARVLLRSGRYRVGEVAARVGYESLPAFSTAYAARFGHPPSIDLAAL